MLRDPLAHPQLSLDDRRHAARGPDLAGEAVRLGPVPQHRRDAGPLLRHEPRPRPGSGPVTQRRGAPAAARLSRSLTAPGVTPRTAAIARCFPTLLLEPP